MALIVGVLFSLFCGDLLVQAVRQYKRAVESEGWHEVTGKIGQTRLWGTRNIDGKMEDAEKLNVEYRYEVEGRVHTGRSVAFYTLVCPKTVKFAKRFVPSMAVTVSINPDDHWD